MSKFLKDSLVWGISISTTVFTFVPDSIIGLVKLFGSIDDAWNLLLNKIGILSLAIIFSSMLNKITNDKRNKRTIKGSGYTIQVEFGDLFKCENCQKVISFDECFTSQVGMAPHEIKASSICGQYLVMNPDLNIKGLIENAGLKPCKERSKFNNQIKYKSGSIVPNGDELLLAFAKLDENGRGYFSSREAYLDSLSVMWSEIHKYYQQKDVCIPILGGGLTSIGDTTPTRQELVDLIIESYKLHAHKIKNPQKLRIICKSRNDISLSRIGETL